MFHQRTITLLVIGSASLYFTGCSPEKKPETKEGYYHSDIYFGKNFPKTYKQGIRDGCTTAKGSYKKSHKLFNNDQYYNDGWFLGRNRCKHLLVVEEDEKKVES